MHIAIKFVIAFFALGLIMLGFIFLMAGGSENVTIGGLMVLGGFGLFIFLYYDSRIEASRPKVVHQEFNVTMDGSGELHERRVNCPSCGAPVEEKDVSLMSGGLVIKCPYCKTASAMEEAPKW